MKEFHLPDPGEGLVEADIVRWVVSEGDEVKVNDILVEIETAKSIVELPSPWAGRIARLMVEEGVTVEVGTPIVLIDDGTGAAAAPVAPAPAQQAAAQAVPLETEPDEVETIEAELIEPYLYPRQGPRLGAMLAEAALARG